jgi:iron complex transport system substrate-binding protein
MVGDSRGRIVLAAGLLVVGVLAATAAASAPSADSQPTAQVDCTFPFSVEDATGAEVTVEAEPERVVTLGPASTQTMWEIGSKETVVGVTRYAEYLDGAENRTNVSGAGEQFVSTEEVVGLEPDLVLAENIVPDETVETLRDAGLTVYKFEESTSIESVYEKTERTGRLVGACEGGEETVAWMQERISTIEEAVEGEDRPRVLYVFGGYTAGNGTFVHEIITAAGGTNVAAEAGISGYQQVSEETVVEQDPEWLVLNSDDPSVPDSRAYRETSAVRENRTVVVDANYVSQPAPRIVYPITELAEAFHPGAFENETLATSPTPGGDNESDARLARP